MLKSSKIPAIRATIIAVFEFWYGIIVLQGSIVLQVFKNVNDESFQFVVSNTTENEKKHADIIFD